MKSNEQGVCPFCNGKNLNYGSIELHGEMICYPWECEDCSHEGEEWYETTFAGHNIITEDGENIEITEDMIEK